MIEMQRVGVAAALVVLLCTPSELRAAESAEPSCALYAQDSFPYGMVWWRVDPERGRDSGIKGFPEGSTAYLVTGVRPDGVLVQNREARYPRLLSWKIVGRSLLSTDGRKTWRRGCSER